MEPVSQHSHRVSKPSSTPAQHPLCPHPPPFQTIISSQKPVANPLFHLHPTVPTRFPSHRLVRQVTRTQPDTKVVFPTTNHLFSKLQVDALNPVCIPGYFLLLKRVVSRDVGLLSLWLRDRRQRCYIPLN